MTLNIWNMFGPWRERRTEIVAWLDRLSPDVVCLQEVLESDDLNQARWLAEHASGEWHVAYAGTEFLAGGGVRFGNAVLSRAPIDATDVVELPCPDAKDDTQRLLLHARCGGVDVYCTHLAWRYEEGLAREQQCERVVAAIDDLSDPKSPLPPILAGDFNAEPDSAEIRHLCGLQSMSGRSTYFQDSWRVSGGSGPGWTWDNRNPFAAAEFEPDRRIDYVFSGWRRHGGAGRVESARVVCDRALTGTYASDHYGLLVEITTP